MPRYLRIYGDFGTLKAIWADDGSWREKRIWNWKIRVNALRLQSWRKPKYRQEEQGVKKNAFQGVCVVHEHLNFEQGIQCKDAAFP